jgi:type IV pilus assembly protein PilW
MSRTLATARTQRGLSIIELLVAMVIGLLLMTGVLQVFFASKQTYSSNEAASRLQENGRFALEFIAQSVRMAGYMEVVNSKKNPPMPIAGINCATSNVCSSQGTGSASDTLGVGLQPRLIEGFRRDCRGHPLSGAAADTDTIINHFAVIAGSLTCKAKILATGDWVKDDSSPLALVEGIDILQVQYGLSAGTSVDGVRQYVSGDRVNNWSNVVAIRIAVLANSVTATNPRTPQRPYVLLDAAPFVPADDGRARQVFTTTINLRNTD